MFSWIKKAFSRRGADPTFPSELDTLIEISGVFGGKMADSENACRKLYLEHESEDHRYLRLTLDSAIAFLVAKMMLIKLEGKKATGKEVNKSYQIGLAASYIRTHHVLRTQLQSGNLIESILLARKQMESLARFTELDSFTYESLKGKTPNIGKIKIAQIGRTYGFMSEHAHFGDIHTTELLGSTLNEDRQCRSPHVFPTFQPLAFKIFEAQSMLDLYFLSAMTSKFPTWDPDLNIDVIVGIGEKAARKAVEIGFVKVSEEA